MLTSNRRSTWSPTLRSRLHARCSRRIASWKGNSAKGLPRIRPSPATRRRAWSSSCVSTNRGTSATTCTPSIARASLSLRRRLGGRPKADPQLRHTRNSNNRHTVNLEIVGAALLADARSRVGVRHRHVARAAEYIQKPVTPHDVEVTQRNVLATEDDQGTPVQPAGCAGPRKHARAPASSNVATGAPRINPDPLTR